MLFVLRTTRSIGVAVLTLIAALAIGLGSSISTATPVSASTASAMTDVHTRPPIPLLPIINPMSVGLHVIDAIAEGIADVVEMVATPPTIAIPAPGRDVT
jgi:hypothetical protein